MLRSILCVLAYLVLCSGALPSAAGSATPLAEAELAAIAAEAGERQRTLGNHHEHPVSPPWTTLTPQRLERLIDAGQLRDVGYFGHGALVDQALAWDLVHFRNLRDIKRFFVQVNGLDYFPEPAADAEHVDGSRIGYYAGATASAEGSALSALFNCLPWETWLVERDDPLLWLMQRGKNVDVPNTHDFGRCVRKQRWDSSFAQATDPDSARGARSAQIIEQRLARQLLDHGCNGSGPDSCLVLLRALRALNPQHRDRVAIIRRLLRETQATQPVEIPEALARYSHSRHQQLPGEYQLTRHQWWRRGIVLSAQLDLIAAEPDAWTRREIDDAVAAAIAMMLQWRRLDWIVNPAGLHHAREYGFENPWQHLPDDGPITAIVSAQARRIGAAAAHDANCAFAKLRRDESLPELWYAYAVERQKLAHPDCATWPIEWIAQHYLAASRSAEPQALAAIAELSALVAEAAEPTLRDALRNGIGRYCPLEDFGADPWGICARNAVIAAAERARVAAENERQAALRATERREQAAVARDPCRNGMLTELQSRLGYGDADGYPIEHVRVACKPLPFIAGSAAVAFFHPGAQADATGDGDYDLHLLFVDRLGQVLAETHEKNAAYSDAVRLDDVSIDTGQYRLARGVRAIGVRTSNAAHCYQCIYAHATLALFVREGKLLRKVFADEIASSIGNDEATPGCVAAAVQTSKTIAIGRDTHHGYADLEVTTTVAKTNGYDEAGDVECKDDATPEHRTETWVYDGNKYAPLPPD